MRAVAARCTLTLRLQGTTEKFRFDSLGDALGELERRARHFAATERSGPQRSIGRTYDPVQLVSLRASVSSRGRTGGVDVRGDGSAEAWTGRWRRTLVAQRPGESPYEALRRSLGE